MFGNVLLVNKVETGTEWVHGVMMEMAIVAHIGDVYVVVHAAVRISVVALVVVIPQYCYSQQKEPRDCAVDCGLDCVGDYVIEQWVDGVEGGEVGV